MLRFAVPVVVAAGLPQSIRSARIVAIIPARYRSTRLPGKPLALIDTRTMVEHVYRRAEQARGVDAVLVATDDERIAKAVADFGGTAVMTSGAHRDRHRPSRRSGPRSRRRHHRERAGRRAIDRARGDQRSDSARCSTGPDEIDRNLAPKNRRSRRSGQSKRGQSRRRHGRVCPLFQPRPDPVRPHGPDASGRLAAHWPVRLSTHASC